jgi:putative mRNA 3-end processing factor
MAALLELRESGLYCAAGDFFVDPWAPVDRAVITHAHADHARPGSRAYLTTRAGAQLLRARVGEEPVIETAGYGERVVIGEATVSLHPAGHVLGSAQVRIERVGEVWAVSGDYKLAPDATCAPFEPLRCHTFVTESTFGLPIFRWAPEIEVMDAIQAWWRTNREAGKTSLLYAYPLGKAQRLLAGLDGAIGPIHAHGSVNRYNEIYRAAGVPLQPSPGWEALPRGKAARGQRLSLAERNLHEAGSGEAMRARGAAFAPGGPGVPFVVEEIGGPPVSARVRGIQVEALRKAPLEAHLQRVRCCW